MVSIDSTGAPAQAAVHASTNKLYLAAWRWHFYAGLYVIPFFAVLAITGMAMAWIAYIDGRDGERIAVQPQAVAQAVSTQADAALAAIPGGTLRQYVAPRAADLAAIFRVDLDGKATMIAVDPYAATVLAEFPRRSGWYDFFDNVHSDLLLGVTGDRMIEIAASLGMVLIATGLYMWWPRNAGWRAALIPSVGRGGRAMWRSLHGVVGFWISLFLVFFLISGLSWAGIWGEKMVQAWSQFPAEKWDNVPLSDDTHASMNHGPKEVPWALEQTPMPASGSQAGNPGLAAGTEVTIDSMDKLARAIGFDGRYQMNVPTGETGVYTFSRDSMSTDSTDPMSDRTVHVDRYTGNILADVRLRGLFARRQGHGGGHCPAHGHHGPVERSRQHARLPVGAVPVRKQRGDVVETPGRGAAAFRAAPAARHAALEGCRSGRAGRLAGVPDGGSNTSCGAGFGSPDPPAHCPIETRAVLIQPQDHGGRGGQAAARFRFRIS
jgi:uncharacterized iron-regulated membrane protein